MNLFGNYKLHAVHKLSCTGTYLFKLSWTIHFRTNCHAQVHNCKNCNGQLHNCTNCHPQVHFCTNCHVSGVSYFLKDGYFWRFDDDQVITNTEIPLNTNNYWFGCWTRSKMFEKKLKNFEKKNVSINKKHLWHI